MENELRYSRHSEFVSYDEQERVHNAQVLLAGCGAGSSLAPHLARMGYATSGLLILADPDVVDITNLNRQAYREKDLGRNKAEALEEIVKEINSSVNTRTVRDGITLSNIQGLVSASDVIVDMIDVGRPEVMLALHRAAKDQRKPVITGLDIGEGIRSFVFYYRNNSAMTLERFLGLPNDFSLEDMSQIDPTSITAQFIIGPVNKPFTDKKQVKDYYSELFNSRVNQLKLYSHLPPEVRKIARKIISRQIDYMPQTNTASGLVGLVHENVLRDLLMGRNVPVVPKVINFNLQQQIHPRGFNLF